MLFIRGVSSYTCDLRLLSSKERNFKLTHYQSVDMAFLRQVMTDHIVIVDDLPDGLDAGDGNDATLFHPAGHDDSYPPGRLRWVIAQPDNDVRGDRRRACPHV